MDKMSASMLFERVAFDAPLAGSNGAGGVVAGWSAPEDATIARAHFRYLRGGETVQAARLTGRQPVVVTVRNSAAARAITAEWRMRDLRTGEAFAVRTDPVLSDDRRWLEITVEGGVAP